MVDFHSVVFLFFALISCLAAVAVVLTGDVVRMAVYLIVSLSGAAALFFMAGAEFVGAMQLMVYVGGTLVLLIFGVMLTARQSLIRVRPHTNEWVLAMVIGLVLLMTSLMPVALAVADWQRPAEPEAIGHIGTPDEMGMALLGAPTHEGSDAGPALGYVLPFELISVFLLIVLIGAAYLARPKRRAQPAVEVRE